MSTAKLIFDPTASLEAPEEPPNFQEIQGQADEPPSLAELLRGTSFLDDDIRVDAEAFVRTSTRKLRGQGPIADALELALARLQADPTDTSGFVDAARVCKAARTGADHGGPDFEELAARCHFYCGVFGRKASAPHVAAFAVGAAYAPRLPEALVQAQAAGAVAWLLIMSGHQPAPGGWTSAKVREFLVAIETTSPLAGRMADRMVLGRRNGRAAVGTTAPDVPANDDTSDDTSMVASAANTMSAVAEQASPAGRRFRVLH
jgi:hypothetical protein